MLAHSHIITGRSPHIVLCACHVLPCRNGSELLNHRRAMATVAGDHLWAQRHHVCPGVRWCDWMVNPHVAMRLIQLLSGGGKLCLCIMLIYHTVTSLLHVLSCTHLVPGDITAAFTYTHTPAHCHRIIWSCSFLCESVLVRIEIKDVVEYSWLEWVISDPSSHVTFLS